MAFSVVNTPGFSPAFDITNLRSAVLDINITSYVNPNGESLTPALFGMNSFFGAIVIQGKRGFAYNPVVQADGTMKLTIAQDNGTATAAALPEIPNTTNHGIVRVLAFGR